HQMQSCRQSFPPSEPAGPVPGDRLRISDTDDIFSAEEMRPCRRGTRSPPRRPGGRPWGRVGRRRAPQASPRVPGGRARGGGAGGVRVPVVSSKFAALPARTVAVPVVVPGVRTPPAVIVQPRVGGRTLNVGVAAFPSTSTVIVEVVGAGVVLPGGAGARTG